jgi:microcin C transport system substrate-binding protein
VCSSDLLTKEGRPFYQQYYDGVESVKKTGERKVTFFFKKGDNRELPLIAGELPVISKNYYSTHSFNAASLDTPLGSGPYEVSDVKAGKSISFKRVQNYWANNLPLMSGRNNVDSISYIVYQDENVGFQGFKALEFDFRLENSAKRWATEYTGPAIDKKIIAKELLSDKTPKGLQGFVFNTRKNIFKDRWVREAIAYAFDFEWSNKNLFYGQYIRTKSYFENSVFASYLYGLPSADELALLEPLRGKIPDEVFTKVYEPPVTDGTGNIRDNLNKAIALLEKAGWVIKDTLLVNKQTGIQMSFEISFDSVAWERISSPFVKNLERLGIKATYRTVDVAQEQKREEQFEYDMIVFVWGESFSPGNEQREFWGSQAADQPGSRNYAGVKDPAIDKLIDSVISAKDFRSQVAAARALDRVLLANHFVIPHWFIPYFRIAYKDRFGRPKIDPPFGIAYPDTWWIDPSKDQSIRSK